MYLINSLLNKSVTKPKEIGLIMDPVPTSAPGNVSALQRVRLMCQNTVKKYPLQIGCGTIAILVLIVAIIIGVCVMTYSSNRSLDNDLFYYSARQFV